MDIHNIKLNFPIPGQPYHFQLETEYTPLDWNKIRSESHYFIQDIRQTVFHRPLRTTTRIGPEFFGTRTFKESTLLESR